MKLVEGMRGVGDEPRLGSGTETETVAEGTLAGTETVVADRILAGIGRNS